MVTANSQKNQLIITIANAGIPDLLNYRDGILGLLGNIEINNCNPELKEHLKTVYKLLLHLQPDEDFLAQHNALLEQGKQSKKVTA